MIRSLARPLLFLLLAVQLVGCSSLRTKSPDHQVSELSAAETRSLNAQLDQAVLEDGMSIINVYRETSGFFDVDQPYLVLINDRVAGALSLGTYLRLAVPPGKHTLSVMHDLMQGEGRPSLKTPAQVIHTETVDTASGEQLFVRVEPYFRILPRREGAQLKRVTPEEGRAIFAPPYTHARIAAANQTYKDYLADLSSAVAYGKWQQAEEQRKQREAAKEEQLRPAAERPYQSTTAAAGEQSSLYAILEGLAAVLFIGLIFIGGGGNASYAVGFSSGGVSAAQTSSASFYAIKGASAAAIGASLPGKLASPSQVPTLGAWARQGSTLTSASGAAYLLNSSGTTIYGNNGGAYLISNTGSAFTGSDGGICRYLSPTQSVSCA